MQHFGVSLWHSFKDVHLSITQTSPVWFWQGTFVSSLLSLSNKGWMINKNILLLLSYFHKLKKINNLKYQSMLCFLFSIIYPILNTNQETQNTEGRKLKYNASAGSKWDWTIENIEAGLFPPHMFFLHDEGSMTHAETLNVPGYNVFNECFGGRIWRLHTPNTSEAKVKACTRHVRVSVCVGV